VKYIKWFSLGNIVFIRLYSLFKSERLNANIKLTLHKALIRSVMTCACPAWESAAETYLLKLQRLQNKALRTIGSFPRSTSVRDMHMDFQIAYICNYITKSCRQCVYSDKYVVLLLARRMYIPLTLFQKILQTNLAQSTSVYELNSWKQS
jgi:hypothetical protein